MRLILSLELPEELTFAFTTPMIITYSNVIINHKALLGKSATSGYKSRFLN